MLKQIKTLWKQSMLLVCMVCLSFSVFSQVNIEFGAVNEYMFNSREALNLVIVNNNPKSFAVNIQGRISDAGGQAVAEFRSAEVVLNTGSNLISPMSASFAELNYFNQDIAEIEHRSGCYPSGNYNICIWLSCVTQDCSGAGAGAAGLEQMKCMPVHIENPTPLILATPGNESEVEEQRPLFTWIPPSPVAGSSSLNYKMILVELMEGQNKADALGMNRPLIEAEGLSHPSLIFPSDLPELEKGKTYAWQVEAYVGKTPIAKSEQWKFKIKKEIKKKDSSNIVFVVKQQLGTETYIVRTDSFRFKYMEQYDFNANTALKYTIYGANNQVVKRFDQNDKLYIVHGVTDYLVNVGFDGLDLKKGTYVLMIENAKNEKWYLRILVQKY